MKKDLRKTYLAMIENSLATRMFQSVYVSDNGETRDILEKGRFSCAFFVSSILKILDLAEGFHCTVESVLDDMKKSNWQEIEISEKMLKGAVLLWEKKDGHYHLGFYLGNEKAISNSSESRVPIIHHWTYNNSRKIIKAYWHPSL